jgi:NAD+ synthase (glutamine-hydrolysing)
MKLRVALAQINPTVGDFAGNAALIHEAVSQAANDGAHDCGFSRDDRDWVSS